MPLAQLDTDHRLQTSVATFAARTEPVTRDAGPHLAAEEQAAAAFERAAKTILKRLPDALAYAGADEPPITRHVPMQKRRPIPRQRRVPRSGVGRRPMHGRRESRRSEQQKIGQ
jgi:hypothetical protein